MNQALEEFKSQVLFILAHLPEGEIISYGELARRAGFKNYARQVGQLLKKLPKDTQLPWHRVVNSKHQISFIEGSDVYIQQKQKLEQEGWMVKNQKLIKKEALKSAP